MKLLAYVMFLCMLVSCKTQQNIELKGDYSSSDYTSEYNLVLNDNKTFTYSIGFNYSIISKCKGDWEYSDHKDFLILKCKDESLLDGMASTYMKNRVNKFKILDKGKKLKKGNIVLTKK